MPTGHAPEEIAGKRYVSLILRLLLDERGGLVYGEVVDLQARMRGRFAAWRHLARTVRAALAKNQED